MPCCSDKHPGSNWRGNRFILAQRPRAVHHRGEAKALVLMTSHGQPAGVWWTRLPASSVCRPGPSPGNGATYRLVWVFLPQFNTTPHVRMWKLNNLSQVCLGACLRVQILFNWKATLTIAVSLVHGLEWPPTLSKRLSCQSNLEIH